MSDSIPHLLLGRLLLLTSRSLSHLIPILLSLSRVRLGSRLFLLLLLLFITVLVLFLLSLSFFLLIFLHLYVLLDDLLCLGTVFLEYSADPLDVHLSLLNNLLRRASLLLSQLGQRLFLHSLRIAPVPCSRALVIRLALLMTRLRLRLDYDLFVLFLFQFFEVVLEISYEALLLLIDNLLVLYSV